MNDQEMTAPENVIKGPWTIKSNRKVKLPDQNIIELQEKIAFAEDLSKSIIVQMIHTMGENAIDISGKDFIRDMAMIIELVQGSICRDLELKHPTHVFMEEFVDLVINPDESIETDVDFSNITWGWKDNDDDPEIS